MRLLLSVGLVSLALADLCRGDDYEDAYRLRGRGEILPLEELLRRQDLGPGARILEIETEFEQGRHLYEIEYLDGGGRVRELRIDARTGKKRMDGEDD
jgi:uncharacterized membrane protein YkoI